MSNDPLAGLRVLDATDTSGAYCGRLLADLGADVVRIEAPGGDALRAHEPVVTSPSGVDVSCFERFVNLNKRSVSIDCADARGRALVGRLIEGADVLLDTPWPDGASTHGLSDAELNTVNPSLVRVSMSPFGTAGPYSTYEGDDLATLGSGGLLVLAGYSDSEPMAVYGEQSFFARSIFGAVGTLLGLLSHRKDGCGVSIDVSAQEVICGALEDAFPEFDLTGRVRCRTGERPREAGTGTYRCADGYVAIVAGRIGTAKAWIALAQWMAECGVSSADALTTEPWTTIAYRGSDLGVARFAEIFEEFAAHRTKQHLYREAQRRNIALAPVNSFGDVLDDEQLASRAYFEGIEDPSSGLELTYPGRPYRIDELGPLLRRPAPSAGEHTAEILGGDLGLVESEIGELSRAGVI